LGYLQATVEYALAHPQLGKEFRKYLQHINLDTVASKNDPEVKERAHPAGSGVRNKVNGEHNGSGSGKRANARTSRRSTATTR
jgi:hypothetical protein